MACFKPLKGYRSPSGKITFDRKNSTGQLAEVPCGQCLGCRLDYSQSWAIRCLHEASLNQDNCFLTLTYEDAQIPSDGSLNKKHFQDFMKRLRFEIAPKKIRFYHCGEYGKKLSRPHYHALIFGYDFEDKRLWSYGVGKSSLYRSTQLERLWPFGYSTIGELNEKTAAYCARYSIKKIKGQALEIIDPDTDLKPYELRDDNTGAIHALQPEYATMSRRPGIGRAWYEKYKTDVFPDDFVVVKGKKVKTPQYYRNLLEGSDPELAASLQKIRSDKAAQNKDNNTRARLEVREKVKQAQLKTLTRSYEDGT